MAQQQLTLNQCWSQITQTEYPGPLPTTDPGAVPSSKLLFPPYNWCVAFLCSMKRDGGLSYSLKTAIQASVSQTRLQSEPSSYSIKGTLSGSASLHIVCICILR